MATVAAAAPVVVETIASGATADALVTTGDIFILLLVIGISGGLRLYFSDSSVGGGAWGGGI